MDMERITVHTQKAQSGFTLTLLERDEWDRLPEIFSTDTEIFHTHWINQLRPMTIDEKPSIREGFLVIKPGVIRLKPELHYIIYRDQDRKGKPCPIQFFISGDQFVLFQNHSVSIKKVMDWAKRGIISEPIDLARVLGSRVLRHHRERLESIEDQMEKLEEEILKNPMSKQQETIILLHHQIIGVKKSLNRHLAAFTRLTVLEHDQKNSWKELITETERELDNVRQTHDLIESLREAYQSAMDNRANEIMKFLTISATILLPISLLASFFGMNFEYMPFTQNPYGIYVFMGLSACIIVFVLYFFKKKDWFR
jgi:magnesium transporter